ncbi:uncharacterized protein RAG0_09567 [Rhynchosporium agropyri]|uniref:Uncharacterized protein n=1 Tax=Rhynchosporium agropyri TaxID=914238 RepID=A0A1E1KYX4_9HELO|nr:uncharacterized protein RAG0_09567 [Rhynchosporium agropyri]
MGSTYDLGPLVGMVWDQYANAGGQVSIEISCLKRLHSVFHRDGRIWLQNNQRTGRAILRDPNPPPPPTYLDDPHIRSRITATQRTPESLEPLYRRVTSEVLSYLYRRTDGFTLVQEDSADNLRPDFTIFKLLFRPGGSDYEHELLIGEHLESVCELDDNDTHNVYAMIQIGLMVKVYRYEDLVFEHLSPVLDLVTQVRDVTAWARYIVDKPLPVVSYSLFTLSCDMMLKLRALSTGGLVYKKAAEIPTKEMSLMLGFQMLCQGLESEERDGASLSRKISFALKIAHNIKSIISSPSYDTRDSDCILKRQNMVKEQVF